MFKPSVIFELTDACNLKCPFCYESKRRRNKFIPSDEYKKLIRFCKPLLIQLTGGEPTLHPEFREILKWSLNHSAVTIFTTNGRGFSKRVNYLEKFFRKPFIAFSLDAPDENHDIIRKHPGLFQEIMNSIAYLKRIKVPVNISTTIFGEGECESLPDGNIKFIRPLIKLAEKLKVFINVQPAAPAKPATRITLGKILLENSKSVWIVNSMPYRRMLVNSHSGAKMCKYNVLNVSFGTTGKKLSTNPRNCYFADNCDMCYYSCVWEPTLLITNFTEVTRDLVSVYAKNIFSYT